MEEGIIRDIGRYDDLIKNENELFNIFMQTFLKSKEDNIEIISLLIA